MSSAELDVDASVEALTVLGQQLIDAILARSPLEEIRALIDAGAPLWFQDEDGTSALHAAAYAEDAELIQTLIEEGAIWNAVDNRQNTAADIVLSLNNESCYQIIRNAGVRSELLLGLLTKKGQVTESALVLKSMDTTAAGSLDTFLTTRLHYTKDANGQDICMVNTGEGDVGVMMGWERNIMQRTASELCDNHTNLTSGLKILNVGFGLGIIDSFFQSLSTPPALHVIIEAHPDVIQFMRSTGWYDKPNVKILQGKWQEFISNEELLAAGGFDVIYTDTFSEDYQALKEFFEWVPDLLADNHSRFSFFNGLGATNATFYDVSTRLADLNLSEVGIDVEWSDVPVNLDGSPNDPWGETRKYFTQPLYRLPVGKMKAV